MSSQSRRVTLSLLVDLYQEICHSILYRHKATVQLCR